MNLESHTELRIWVWISSANKCNIFVTLRLDCNRVDRSQNGTCNAELSSIKPESRESIQSKITEPACAEFSATQVGNSAKQTNHRVRSDKTSAVPYFVFLPTMPYFWEGRRYYFLVSSEAVNFLQVPTVFKMADYRQTLL